MKQQNLPKPQNSAARIEALSVLPVFLNLQGQKAFVIGGSIGALWKTELLLQAGAEVTLVCEAPSLEVLQFASRTFGAALKLEPLNWRDMPFDGAAIVVADVSADEAHELCQKARSAGAMVNVVDKPEFCQFQFGSIVNKSPLVIGISTAGAAPVLAQQVRSMVEAVLPPNIQSVAMRAARIRARVHERLAESAARRRYWGAFFGKAFGFKPKVLGSGGSSYTIETCDAEDLTLRDLRALQSADTVYLAAGANPDIAKLARREAVHFEVDNNGLQNQRSVNRGNCVFIK